MPDPQDVYRDPQRYWSFLTAASDEEFEGQHFDRKELCRPRPDNTLSDTELKQFLNDQIVPTISAFANSNREGGLLVLGIAKDGEIKGTKHLSESQKNSYLRLDNVLVSHGAEVKYVPCTNAKGEDDAVCLMYARHAERAICETVKQPPKSWSREGPKTVLHTVVRREQLQRDKKIVEFERTPCEEFHPDQLDVGVMKEFRTSYLPEAGSEQDDEDLLYQIGALRRVGSDLFWTNAGLLFFAANPQRVLPESRIRLLNFDLPIAEHETRSLPSIEKPFAGPLTKQIRDFRTFINESAFFKRYQWRKPDGGFRDEPEYPSIAVDEAVVNAVAHRDYAVGLPIQVEKYTDALLVRSSGPVVQLDRHVPSSFSLENTQLDHMPRNPRLVSWLRSMKDAHGLAYVQALREGTQKMYRTMVDIGLPPPEYSVSAATTTVTLRNNAAEREAEIRAASRAATPQTPTTEFTNLYPFSGGFLAVGRETREENRQRQRAVLQALSDKLEATNWYVESIKYGSLTAHRRGSEFKASFNATQFVRLYPAYAMQIREYGGRTCLVVDYGVTVQSVRTVQKALQHLGPGDLLGRSAVAQWEGGWRRGKITAVDAEWTRVLLWDYETEVHVPNAQVIPKLTEPQIKQALSSAGVIYDLENEIKRASLSLQPNASRTRAEYIQSTVEDIALHVFPLNVGGIEFRFSTTPLGLSRSRRSANTLPVVTLAEPSVEFRTQRSSPDIREGITTFGAYDNEARDIEIVPVCTTGMRERMRALIQRLKVGRFKYKGAERTFSTRLKYSSIVTAELDEIAHECERLTQENPGWGGNPERSRIFLVYCPEGSYDRDDENGPYYRIKRHLFELGIPCQMVDTPTLRNPDFKDLNLALNITAKTGQTPWVLPEGMPDADFFIGLSHTSSKRGSGERLMGFANVFNQYGRWVFYSGSGETFTYEDRTRHFEGLIHKTLSQLQLSDSPSIHFHYSEKFSREDRAAILRAARNIRPGGKYTFVWLNSGHRVRLFDARPETDGSLSRGKYMIASAKQAYLSTTGYNPYRKVLGTPRALEINVRVEYPAGAVSAPPDLRTIALQVLCLTKLNWASSDSHSGEPITTKYAKNIAYLTAAFLRQDSSFRLHPVLEQTPWFI